MNDKGDFLVGVILGATVGTVLGMLFAPQSGRETRQRIQEGVTTLAEDVSNRATEVTSRVKGSVQDRISSIRGQVAELSDSDTADAGV